MMVVGGTTRTVRPHGRALWALVAAVLLWTGFSIPASADLLIVSEQDGHRQQLLMTKGAVATLNPDESRMLLDCATGQLTIVSAPGDKKYWQGSVEDLTRELEEAIQSAMGGLSGGGAVPGLDLSSIFGSGPQDVAVRVNEVGTDAVAGYGAAHFRVQYRQSGSDWKTYEDIWVSERLLREVQEEVGSCTAVAFDIMRTLASLSSLGMGVTAAVVADPDYVALFDRGFPMRTQTRIEVFGMKMEVNSKVVEVSRDPISREFFTLPDGYRRVENVRELFGI